MKRFLLLFLMFAACLTSCTKEYCAVIEMPIERKNQTTCGIEECAKRVVQDVLKRIDPITRGSIREIENVGVVTYQELFGSQFSRVNDSLFIHPDSLGLVFVNFKDSLGYSLLIPRFDEDDNKLDEDIDGDSNTPLQLLAITDSGTISTEQIMSDGAGGWQSTLPDDSTETTCDENWEGWSVGNANQNTFANNLLCSYLYNKTYQPELYVDTTEDLNDMNVVNNVALDQKGPLIFTTWDQWEPFNNLVTTQSKNGGNCPIGCTVIASAQILAYFANRDLVWFFGVNDIYWRHIRSYKSSSVEENSNDISISTIEKDIAIFAKNIADGIGVSYRKKDNGSGVALPSEVQSYLKKDLLYNVSAWKLWGSKAKRLKEIVNSINANKPVFISAADGLEGHSWVVDGYMKNEDSTKDKHDYYIHCNFGWGGTSDGWYLIDMIHSGKSFNYNYMFSYIFFE